MLYAQARYYDPRNGRFNAEDTHWHPGNMIFGDVWNVLPNAGVAPYRVGILQSKNLYAYCVGNPLRFVDKDGNTVTVTQDGNNITIDAEFNFISGGRVNGKDLIPYRPFGACSSLGGVDLGVSYSSLFLSGVRSYWGGSFGDYQVTVNAIRSENGIPVKILDGNGTSNLTVRGGIFNTISATQWWSNSNRGVITMYTGDTRHPSTMPYSARQFMWVAAHEFGHAMGLADASGFENSRGFRSIMNAFGMDVQARDIAALLEAWNTGEWQMWPYMGDPLPRTPGFSLALKCLD